MESNLKLLAAINYLESQIKALKLNHGIDGKDGRDGADGRDGTNGIDGRDGKDGVDGLDGADGADGIGIVSAYLAADGDLVLVLSDGTELPVELPDGLYRSSEGDIYNISMGGGLISKLNDEGAGIVFIGDVEPTTELKKYVWIQTGLGPTGDDHTMWVRTCED